MIIWSLTQVQIGLRVDGVDLGNKPGPSSRGASNPTASVVLIGMRGAGKSHIGKCAAGSLGWTFLDADACFEDRHGPLASFVKERGWEAFRAAELEVLDALLKAYPVDHIISLGGGVVETKAARDMLTLYACEGGPVVYINRYASDIEAYLSRDATRPAYGEPVETVLQRRLPWFADCSSHEFVNVFNDDHIVSAATIGRYFGHITGVRPNLALVTGRRSYFVSLTFPEVSAALPLIDDVTTGVDAVELRVDLLCEGGASATAPNMPSLSYVKAQLGLLQSATALPIIFTVRTESQGGAYPDKAEDNAFALLDLALRMGCEYVDVEMSWSPARLAGLRQRKGASQIIASWHDWNGKLNWRGTDIKNIYAAASNTGDVVKIVGKARSVTDNLELLSFVQSTSGPACKPFIGINIGDVGRLSRILNTVLTPVSHPRLPFAAAPGQLNFAQIQQALHLMGMLPAQQYYLLGSPISKSMSPVLHNTGFHILGLPHRYQLHETATIDGTVESLLNQSDFGGASVTIPHKLAIMPLLHSLSVEAVAIGAVNTVIPRRRADGTRELFGDNTDWAGIVAVICKKMPATKGSNTLVIGAGGTARAAIYAMHALGAATIYIWNRTHKKAEELAASYPQSMNVCPLLLSAGFTQGNPGIVVSAVPAAADLETSILHKHIFKSTNGIAVDMAYSPLHTPFLHMAESASTLR